MNAAAWILASVFFGSIYFLPTLAARSRHHHNTEAILLLNLFFGWTILGWIAALIWASTAVHHREDWPYIERR
jgi:amino acid transporter